MFTDELRNKAAGILDACRKNGLKLATAESCTGGLIAALLTEIPGSSDVFERGFITYSNQSKTDLLGVDPDLIKENGAVSEPVAAAMARGALEHAKVDIAVSVTGIAGPGGGTAEKQVGLVYIGIATRQQLEHFHILRAVHPLSPWERGRGEGDAASCASKYAAAPSSGASRHLLPKGEGNGKRGVHYENALNITKNNFSGDRSEIRLKSVTKALEMLKDSLSRSFSCVA